MSIKELQELQNDIYDSFKNLEPAEGFKLMSHNHSLFTGYQDFQNEFIYNAYKGLEYKLFTQRLYTYIHQCIQEAIKQEEARLEKEAEEQARREAEQKERLEKQQDEEQARQEAEQKARIEKQQAEEQARHEAEQKARIEKQQAEEQARREAEQKAQLEKQQAEEQARREAEQKARLEKQQAEEQARHEVEQNIQNQKPQKSQNPIRIYNNSNSYNYEDSPYDAPLAWYQVSDKTFKQMFIGLLVVVFVVFVVVIHPYFFMSIPPEARKDNDTTLQLQTNTDFSLMEGDERIVEMFEFKVSYASIKDVHRLANKIQGGIKRPKNAFAESSQKMLENMPTEEIEALLRDSNPSIGENGYIQNIQNIILSKALLSAKSKEKTTETPKEPCTKLWKVPEGYTLDKALMANGATTKNLDFYRKWTIEFSGNQGKFIIENSSDDSVKYQLRVGETITLFFPCPN